MNSGTRTPPDLLRVTVSDPPGYDILWRMSIVSIEVDDELMARARKLAEARNMTVAEMTRRLLHVATAPRLPCNELPPLTRRALGMLPPMSDQHAEQILDEERRRKHEPR